jgi:glycosyltransferase involved in cell wall biosynthesis
MINILYIRDSSGIYGAERVILTTAKNINPEKYNFMLLCMQREDADSQSLLNLAVYFKITVLTVKVNSSFDVSAILRIRKIIKKHQVQIIHTHDFKSDFYGLAATLFLKTKRLLTAHGSTRDSVIKKFYLFFTERIVYKFYDRIIVVSEDVAAYLKKRHVDNNKMIVIQNGLDPDILTYSDSEGTGSLFNSGVIHHTDRLFAVIGRLYPDKGHRFFLEAFSKLTAEFKNVKAILIGDGPNRSVLEKLVRNLKLEKTVFVLGYKKSIKPFYSRINYIVISSIREGLPYVLLEAMFLKIPVLATSVGDIPLLIKDDKSGYLVAPADSEALYQGMRKMLIQPEHKLNEFITEAYKTVFDRFSAKRMVQNLENVYTNLTAK